jgi:DNA-binding response OmpR family regulator
MKNTNTNTNTNTVPVAEDDINNTNADAVLVAENDLNLGLAWENWLGELGYAVTRTTNKADVLARFQPGFYALVVLDIRMPSVRGRRINDEAGIEAAVEMRRLDPSVSVLFLTASDNEDIEVDALKLPGEGERDFVRKPCGKKAFQLRVRRIARNNQFPFGPHAVIDKREHTATIIGGETPRHLTPQVLDLAVVFARNKNICLSRAELIAQWGWDGGSLDESVRRLREAVNDVGHTIIETIRGTGYIYKPLQSLPQNARRHLMQQVLDLAVVFARNKNIRLSRKKLIAQWGWDEGFLDAAVRRLRQAVHDDEHTIIKDIHGGGYIYNPPQPPAQNAAAPDAADARLCQKQKPQP